MVITSASSEAHGALVAFRVVDPNSIERAIPSPLRGAQVSVSAEIDIRAQFPIKVAAKTTCHLSAATFNFYFFMDHGQFKLTLTPNLALFTLSSPTYLITTRNRGDAFSVFFFPCLTPLLDNAGRCNVLPLPPRLRASDEFSFLFILGAICGFSSPTAITSSYPWHTPHLSVPVPSVLVNLFTPAIQTRSEHPSSTPPCNSESVQVGLWKTYYSIPFWRTTR